MQEGVILRANLLLGRYYCRRQKQETSDLLRLLIPVVVRSRDLSSYGPKQRKKEKKRNTSSFQKYFLVIIVIHFFLVPPRVKPKPEDGNIVVKKGTEVALECNASGNPVPTITWTREVCKYLKFFLFFVD